jgi:hypothetical protein
VGHGIADGPVSTVVACHTRRSRIRVLGAATPWASAMRARRLNALIMAMPIDTDDDLTLRKMVLQLFGNVVGRIGFRNPRKGLGPGKRSPLAWREQGRLAPGIEQQQPSVSSPRLNASPLCM